MIKINEISWLSGFIEQIPKYELMVNKRGEK